MKFLSIYLLALALNASANGFAQTMTLNEKAITYTELFKLIRKHTGCQVFYKSEALNSQEKINITAVNASIYQVLNEVFKNKKVQYSVLNKSIVIKPIPERLFAYENARYLSIPEYAFETVKGTVTDQEGKPLADVSVSVEGTTKGTTTKANGSFSIDVTPGESLTFSRIGYLPITIKPEFGKDLNIKMEQEEDIGDEVIVVGYGTQKKTHLTGAVSVIGSDQIENRPATNALAALQGLAPGLTITRNNGQPGREGWDLLIRGISSVNGSNSPLIIVDGAPGSITTLNPNDIETVTILKDAEAAIYGAEAAGGVVIVTTKLGSAKKITVGYNALFTTNKAFNTPERNPSWVEAEQLNLARFNAGQSAEWSEEQIRWMKDPDTNYVKKPNGTWGFYENLDFTKILLRSSTRSSQHDLSISGQTEKTRYLFSAGYYSQNGIFALGPDSHKRINARMNISTQLNKTFAFSSRIGYTNLSTLFPIQNTDGDGGLLYELYEFRATSPLYLPNDDGSTAGSYDSTKYSGGTTYARLKDGGYNENRSHLLDGVFALNAKSVLKGLDFTLQYSPRIIVNENLALAKQLYIWSTATSYLPLNANNNVTKNNAVSTTQNLQFLANYDYRTRGHHFHVLGGYQYDEYRLKSITANANNIISSELPSLNYLANPIANPPTIGDDYNSKVLISVFGKLSYDYLDKYIFQFTLRNDASSQLAPGLRSGTFPSVAGAWNLHKEKWFPDNNVLNSLKIRASYGQLGNSYVLGYYDYLQLLTPGGTYPFNNQRSNSLVVSSFASSEKGWEVVESKNIGFDASLFKDRLTTNFSYFIRDNKNMLISPTVPDIFGLIPAQRNIAAMRSSGWEFEFKWKDVISDKFSYWVGGNISDAKNKITQYLGRSSIGLGVNNIIEGFPYQTVWGYRTEGLYSDTAGGVTAVSLVPTKTGPGDVKYLDLNGDGKINAGGASVANHGDLQLLGEIAPHYSFGFSMGAQYKGFDFTSFFQGVLKRKMLIYANLAQPYIQSWRQAWKSQNDYWTPDNLDAQLPRLYLGGTHNTAVSDFWIQDANYIRLKNLQFGYTLPQKLTSRVGLSRLRIYFTGQDLWEKTGMKLDVFDPEQPNNGGFNYPFFRSYAVGVNLNF